MKSILRSEKKVIRNLLIGVFVFILSCIIILTIYIATYKNPADHLLSEASIVEKQVQVGDVNFNYAEGPDNGPVLVLLHAQLLDWYTYSSVLPELSQYYHVYAIDYPGHGKTTVPTDYEMSAKNIGASLSDFITQVIGEQVYITGNSSGGLLTTWIAANHPELVKGIILEDPPLFSSEYPVVQDTIAYRSFTSSYNAIESGEDDDFLMYWINNSSQFFKTYTFPGAQQLIKGMVNLYRTIHPDRPLDLPFMPVSVQEMLRGLNYYDPHFGAAFYEGTWNEEFDHATALENIQCPVVLIQADFSYTEDGILNGAMSQEMADTAMSLLKDGEYIRVNAGHVTNLEVPDEFITIVEEFIEECENGR